MRRITPSMVIATLALIVSLSGGAYAAGRYVITSTHQIRPAVLRHLHGARGARGPIGPAGPAGTTTTTAPAPPADLHDIGAASTNLASASIAAGQTVQLVAQCRTGGIVGGGWKADPPATVSESRFAPPGDVIVAQGSSGGITVTTYNTAEAWVITVTNPSSGSIRATDIAYCAPR